MNIIEFLTEYINNNYQKELLALFFIAVEYRKRDCDLDYYYIKTTDIVIYIFI